MATTTPNFGWPVPTSTDLVKDGATAIEALGDGIDTSLVDLKGGTTGQVLSKTTNTDMDFTWVTTDDANAIQNAIVNAKGDIIGASANDVPAITSAGANGTNLVADSSTSTGLRWQDDYAAGKNKIINGDYGIWARGTSFTNPVNGAYTADRWRINFAGGTAPTTATLSQQTFTPGTAPVAGYEGTYFWRYAVTTKGGSATYFETKQRIEDVRTFAGQTATYSFWAKADSARTLDVYWEQSFGSGGSGAVTTSLVSVSVTTAWARYSVTISVPSVSGKTIGAGSYGAPAIRLDMADGMTLDLWGMQVEAGSVATAFQTATGSIQGELAAAQRYYYRATFDAAPSRLGSGFCTTTTNGQIAFNFPVQMRIEPSALEQSGTAGDYSVAVASGTATCNAVPAFFAGQRNGGVVNFPVASGLVAGQGVMLRPVNTSAFLGWSAEL